MGNLRGARVCCGAAQGRDRQVRGPRPGRLPLGRSADTTVSPTVPFGAEFRPHSAVPLSVLTWSEQSHERCDRGGGGCLPVS